MLSGEILSFVSSPDFSPEIFTGNTSLHEWRSLVNDPKKPLLNRITNGLYPPGSTFKMITAIALLEGLMMSTYSSNVLKNGSTLKSFSLEKNT